jgi:hypothetical protein
MTRPWWKDYPRRYWSEVDWQRWERDGKPRVPRDEVLEKQGQPINPTLPLAPAAQTLSSGFRLHPRKSTAQDARGKSIDALLEKLGIR